MRTKKLISILLAIAFVVTSASLMAVSTSASSDFKVVYLDSTKGNDNNSGATVGKAVATLFAAVDKLRDGGGIIDVVGDTIIDDPNLTQDMRSATGYQLDMPAHTGKIYITSTNGSKLIKTEPTTGTVISFFGDLEFYNITFESTVSQNTNIYMYGNEITMGYGVDAIAIAPNYYPRIFGYSANPEDGLQGNPVINVYSGKYGQVYGAGTAGAKLLTGDITINLYGGTIENV